MSTAHVSGIGCEALFTFLAGSAVVECLTLTRGVAGSRLTGVTALFP